MSGELEAAGALATAGAVGAALEGREGGEPGSGNCPNCDTPVTGRFCSNCGQHARPIRKLTHVLSEFVHNLYHFDNKTWRTLPMVLFRPGTLTRNYVFGKRARYLAPLTTFLFSIFLMFFAFSTISAPVNVNDGRGQVVSEDDINEAREELAQAQRDLANAHANPDTDMPAGLEVRLAENAVNLAQQQVTRLESERAAAAARAERQAAANNSPIQVQVGDERPPTATQGPPTPAAPPAMTDSATPPAVAVSPAADSDPQTWQDLMREIAQSDDFTVIRGNDELNERVRRKFENPDFALYQIQDAASKYSFLLAPLSLPFIMLLFLWKRGVTLYDHMAYALYALAFAAILFSAAVLLGEVSFIGWASAWLLLALPVHMWFHLKGAYALGWWSATWRTAFMLVFSYFVALIFTILVVVLGLTG